MSYRWAVNLFFLVNGMIWANWAVRLPDLQDKYEMGNDTLGLILLAYATGAFVGMPVTGWLIEQLGSKRITTIAGLALPLFFFFVPLVPGIMLLFVPFFLMGLATGIKDVAMNAQAVDVEKHLTKPIMTMFHALFSIGMVIGGIMGGWCKTQGISLEIHFMAIAIISFIVLAWSSFYLFPDKIEKQKKSAMLAWPKGPVVVLGLIAFCCMMGEGAMADWSTNYMKQIINAPIAIHSFALTGFAGAMTLGRLFGDRGRERFGDKSMMMGGSILAILGMALILFSNSPWIVIAGFASVGLGLSNIVPIVYSLAGTLPDIPAGVGIAMSTTIGYTGFMFGPPIIGWIADYKDLQWGLGFLGILLVLMLALVLRKTA